MARPLLVLIALVALIAGACGSDSGGGSAATGPVAFSGTTLDGTELTSADYAGQDLILWFWAPW